MSKNEMIKIEDIWKATDNGRTIIESIYPQSKSSFERKKNFKIRDDDKAASCSVFLRDNVWLIQDKGGRDTKAKNAIQLLMEQCNLTFPKALIEAKVKYCNGHSVGLFEVKYPEPLIQKSDKKCNEIEIQTKAEFTEKELKTIGDKITPEICAKFKLSPVEFYYTKAKENEFSFKISSTPEYPIYYYDYGTWGKIWQPFSKDFRFLYKGKKPEDHIFGDDKVMDLLDKSGKKLAIVSKSNENLSESEDEEQNDSILKIEELILCTGASDAMNVYAIGYNVIWLNSETATFTTIQHKKIMKICDTLYNLPDIDETGKREALKLGLKFLDIKTIWLPEKLRFYKDWKGKPCKDIRDFFKYYKDERYPNLDYFKLLVRNSLPLKFWNVIPVFNKKGEFSHFKYEINNEQLYLFLNANGYYTIDVKTNKKEYTFVKINENNIVTEIKHDRIVENINSFVSNYLRENPELYNVTLHNAIHRSDQLKISSLCNLKRIYPDFKCFSKDYEYLFFRNNKALKITKESIEEYKLTDTTKFIWDYKIIDKDFKKLDSLISINYTKEYSTLLNQLKTVPTNSNEYNELETKIKEYPELDKYKLEINDKNFIYIKFLYNTGRMYWQKEEKGEKLTEEERKECDLHFISKIVALGYLLYRFKEKGNAYAVRAMETEQSLIGTHKGRTGKSIFLETPKYLLKYVYVDGRKKAIMDNQFLFGTVTKDTEYLYIEDMQENVDLHDFLNVIQGDMTIEPKYIQGYPLPFEDSPKIGMNSNHAVKNLDSSLRDRLWFVGFSNYYHGEDENEKLTKRSPYTEFGKNLYDDFTPEEWNKFYNFCAECIHIYLKFRTKIEPPLHDIKKRNLQISMGDTFLDWAENYFTTENSTLDKFLPRSTVFEAYMESLPKKEQATMKLTPKFKEKIKNYAIYKEYTFNPTELYTNETDKKECRIRMKNEVTGKMEEHYYLSTMELQKANINGEEIFVEPMPF